MACFLFKNAADFLDLICFRASEYFNLFQIQIVAEVFLIKCFSLFKFVLATESLVVSALSFYKPENVACEKN